MTGKIYIAGASVELARCLRAIDLAKRLGLDVTYNWAEDVRANLAAGRSDADLTDAQAKQHATNDLRGVTTAEALIFLAPAPGVVTRGCWGELCAAAVRGVPIIVSRENALRATIFEALAVAEAPSDRAAVILARRLVAPHLDEEG